MPITVPPPGRLSTSVFCVHASCSLRAVMRAIMSLPAPGENGTIRRIGRSGYEVCASVALAASSAAAAASIDAALKHAPFLSAKFSRYGMPLANTGLMPLTRPLGAWDTAQRLRQVPAYRLIASAPTAPVMVPPYQALRTRRWTASPHDGQFPPLCTM